MAIKIISCGKTFQKTIQGVTFDLARPTLDDDMALQRGYTKRGQMDVPGYIQAKLERSIRGWEPNIDVDGEARGYDRSLIAHFPDWLKVELLEALNEARPTEDQSGS